MQAGEGAIVNIGSVVGLAPEFGMSVYGATKAFVLFLSQGLSLELAPKGVYVQAVLPAATRTEIWERAGIDINTLPEVMEVGELVDAALVGFDRRELVTIPPLQDAALGCPGCRAAGPAFGHQAGAGRRALSNARIKHLQWMRHLRCAVSLMRESATPRLVFQRPAKNVCGLDNKGDSQGMAGTNLQGHESAADSPGKEAPGLRAYRPTRGLVKPMRGAVPCC